mmetsp:Transcript_6068/g.7837  ORF Transcript_6068/g.7837 Transcript_6068/m.7837 type:complete len:346 (+) Transcript_6068:66-1103(+)
MISSVVVRQRVCTHRRPCCLLLELFPLQQFRSPARTFSTNQSNSPVPPPTNTLKSNSTTTTTNNNNNNSNNKKYSSSLATAGGVAVAVFGSTVAARYWYTHYIFPARENDHKYISHLRKDASKVVVTLPTMPPPDETKRLPLQQHYEMYAQDFVTFLQEQETRLENAKLNAKNESAEFLHQELVAALFQECSRRIPEFVNWYLAYPTSYHLLTIAMTSAATHIVTFQNPQDLQQAVSRDVQDYVCQKYQAIVLRPALTDPKLNRAFYKSVQAAHEQYLQALTTLENSLQQFVGQNATVYHKAPDRNSVVMDLDWKTQLQKTYHIPVVYEKSPQFSIAVIGADICC